MALAKPSITGGPQGTPPPGIARVLARIFATGFGTGYLPIAQGAAGSALLALIWLLWMPDSLTVQIAVVALLHLVSVPLSSWGERMWGHDPGRVTVDEFAGQSIALLALPVAPIPVALGFVLFRLFDTFKLPLVRDHVESLQGGWGVTLDDTIAGIMARVAIIPFMLLLP